MITSKLNVAHLSTCARTAARISHLPGVATHDWCECAAKWLVSFCPDCVASVTIADTQGGREQGPGSIAVIASGAWSEHDPVPSRRVHPDTAADLGWSLADGPGGGGKPGTHPRLAKLRDLSAWSRWPVTPAGKRWSKLGVREMLVGDMVLTDGPSPRLLLVEVGSGHALQRFDRAEPEMITSVMPVLAERARLAFGPNYSQSLTSREQMILVELVSGASVREIAEKIERSPHTVHDHVKSLHRKLNASSRGELVSRYLGFGAACGDEPGTGDDAGARITVRKARPASPSHSS